MQSLLQTTRDHLALFARTPLKSSGKPPRLNTVKARRLHLERFARHFDERHTDCSLTDFKEWYVNLTEASSISNCNQALTALTGFVDYLRDSKVFNEQDFESWQRFHKSQYRRIQSGEYTARKWCNPAELRALFNAMLQSRYPSQVCRDIAFFSLIPLGPSRLNESVQLQLQHVTPTTKDNAPAFELNIPGDIRKNHKPLRLWVISDIYFGDVDILAYWQQYDTFRRKQTGTLADPAAPYFIALREPHFGTMLSDQTMHQDFKRIAIRAGFPAITSHRLRHTFGHVIDPTMPREQMQKLFGHANAQTTAIYTNGDDPDAQFQARKAAYEHLSHYSNLKQ